MTVAALTSSGTSDAARYVAEQGEVGRRRLQDSYVLGMGGKGVIDELWAVAGDCRFPGWDGYGADSVSAEAIRMAYRFLQALPLGTPPPSVGAEPDGQITFEWHRGPLHTLSVSVTAEGELHYAALLGPAKAYGTERLSWVAPQPILELIRRINPYER
jgi:hypothetical protein